MIQGIKRNQLGIMSVLLKLGSFAIFLLGIILNWICSMRTLVFFLISFFVIDFFIDTRNDMEEFANMIDSKFGQKSKGLFASMKSGVVGGLSQMNSNIFKKI